MLPQSDFGQDESGNVKFTMKSIPLFDDEKDGDGQSSTEIVKR